MRAGMGEIVFAPLYETLRRRGVRFEFFHAWRTCGFPAMKRRTLPRSSSTSRPACAKARTTRRWSTSAACRAGRRSPTYAQLDDGERLRTEAWDFESFWGPPPRRPKAAASRRDFDFVVLGVGIGAVPHVCSEILARDVRLRDMCENVKTVATQAGQAWLAEDLPALGWPLAVGHAVRFRRAVRHLG
jgi:hypothetical protein